MDHFWLGLLIGVFVGANVGVVVAGLIGVNRREKARGDDQDILQGRAFDLRN